MKRKLGTVFAALALAVVGSQVFSSTGAEDSANIEPREMAERLANCIAEDDFDALKMEMWKCSVDEGVVAPLADQLTLPYKRMCEGLGARSKVELLKSEMIGSSIARYSYAEFHSRGVVVWHFEFIKPADDWKLHAYGWGPLRLDGGAVMASVPQ
jgi:hypothetical protein